MREGYSTCPVCVSVCVSVFSPFTSRNQAYKQQYQRLQRDTGMKCKKGFFFKTQAYSTVSLHRQRTSRRQRASHLHRLVNGDVYGSRILITTPTSLSHVRATRWQSRIFSVFARMCARGISHESVRIYGCRVRPNHLLRFLASSTHFIIMAGLNACGLQSKLLITPLSE